MCVCVFFFFFFGGGGGDAYLPYISAFYIYYHYVPLCVRVHGCIFTTYIYIYMHLCVCVRACAYLLHVYMQPCV